LFDAERGSGYEDTACTGRSKNHCGGGRLVLPVSGEILSDICQLVGELDPATLPPPP